MREQTNARMMAQVTAEALGAVAVLLVPYGLVAVLDGVLDALVSMVQVTG